MGGQTLSFENIEGCYIPDITFECEVTSLTAPTATDNCAVTIIATHDATLPITTLGTTVVTWTYDDGNGNVSTQGQNVIIAPIPVSATLPDITAECEVVSLAAQTATLCGVTITGATTAIFPITGTTVVTWTYDDGNGNISTQDQNVIITDAIAPVADVATLSDLTDECSVDTPTAPTATDNCSGTITGTTTAIFPITETTVVTWSHVDGNGNVSTQDQNVIITDAIAPVADIATLSDLTDECSVTPTAPTATDNCSGTITGTTTAIFPITSQGTTVVTWTYNDGNGNISTQDQNVIITDITAPIIICPADMIFDANPVSCDYTNIETVIYDIPLSQAIYSGTFGANCNGTEDMYTCGGQIGISWTSIGTVTPESITVEYYQIWNNDGAPASATFNGISDNDYVGPLASCSNSIVTQSLTPVNYVVGGLNTVIINPVNCIVFDENPDITWTPQSYARVTVEYSSIGEPVTADNCAVASVTNDAPATFPLGVTTVTWTATDDAGNTSTCNQLVTVNDVTAPVVDIATLTDLTDECSVTPMAPIATDACTGTITGTTTTEFPITAQGTTVVTWTYDDGNGNISTQDQYVIIALIPVLVTLPDIIAECEVVSLVAPIATLCGVTIIGTTTTVLPITTLGTAVVVWTYDDGNGNISTQNQNVIIAPIPDSATLSDIIAECEVVSLTAPTATFACGVIITGTTTTVFPITTQGTTVVTWSYNGGNGNITTQDQNVIITDAIAPVADVAILSDLTDECSVDTPTAPAATDNCSGTITGTTTAIFPIIGTTVVTWTYVDGSGNVSTQDQNVIITNTIAPVADVATLSDLTDECSVDAPTAPTATDNCSGIITGTTTTEFPITAQGTTVVTWTYGDGNGNVSTQDQNVIITDAIAPVADVATLSDLTDECSVDTPTAPTATDNCSGIITGTTTTVFPMTAQGTTVVTWSYDDGNGNVSTQDQNVIITDITAPIADVATLSDLINECSVAAPTAPTATDACTGTITGTTTTEFPITAQGTTVVTWTYDDGNGNISTQDQYVIIEDITNPDTLPVLVDVTGECTATAIAPTTTDNCAGTITGTTIDPLTYTDQGTHVITWNFDDGNGNSITVDQNVIVLNDMTPPVIPILADVTGECEATALTLTTIDACAGTITGTTTDPLTYATQGTHVITWNFDDGNGNDIDVTQNVVIADITNPITPTLADVTGECTATAVVPTTTDACAGTITGTTTDPLTYSAQGTHTITWNFDDGNGNNIDVTQDVVIDDITAPEITCPDNIEVFNDLASCGAVVTYTAPEGIDNCEGAITVLTSGLGSGSIFPIGVSTETYTATDAVGNITECSFTITVVDNEVPVISCPENVETCNPIVEGIAPVITDNCPDFAVTYTFTGATTGDGEDDASATEFNVGLTTVTYEVVDASGLSATCSFDVTVSPVYSEDVADSFCEGSEYELPDGTIVTEAGEYTLVFENVNGCDSTIVTTLTVNPLAVAEFEVATDMLTVTLTGMSANAVDFAWDLGDGTTDDAENVEYTYALDGAYTIIQSVTNECNTDTAMHVVAVSATLIDANDITNIKVYPNPTSGDLYIELGEDYSKCKLEILDVTSKVLYATDNLENNYIHVDINDFIDGIYLVKIQGEKYQKVVRLIKQ